jgi:DNA repair exonuclease SbcCD ATPase subunit
MNNENSIAPRFLNILEHYVTILERENDELKLVSCDDSCQDNVNSLIKLKAEIKELKAELERKDILFKDYSKRAREHHECGEEYERELKAELDKYRTDNKWLANRNGEIIKREKKAIDELKAENKELEKRYKYFLKQYNHDVGCSKKHEYVDNVFNDKCGGINQ